MLQPGCQSPSLAPRQLTDQRQAARPAGVLKGVRHRQHARPHLHNAQHPVRRCGRCLDAREKRQLAAQQCSCRVRSLPPATALSSSALRAPTAEHISVICVQRNVQLFLTQPATGPWLHVLCRSAASPTGAGLMGAHSTHHARPRWDACGIQFYLCANHRRSARAQSQLSRAGACARASPRHPKRTVLPFPAGVVQVEHAAKKGGAVTGENRQSTKE